MSREPEEEPPGQHSRRRLRWRRSRGNRRWRSWRSASTCIPARSVSGSSNCWSGRRMYLPGKARRRRVRRWRICRPRSGGWRWRTIFQRSARAHRRTQRQAMVDRGHRSTSAAVPDSGAVAFQPVLPAGAGLGTGSRADAGDRRGPPQAPVLRQPAHTRCTERRGPRRRPRSCAYADAQDGHRGAVPKAEAVQGEPGAQGLSVPVARA